jgi:hypothetical protein
VENTAKLIEAIARLIAAAAWPAVAAFALVLLGPSIRDFISSLAELRLKGGGFEASATRRLNFDTVSEKLHEFWKPGGKIDRAHAAKIAACMKQLGISGSIGGLINAGTAEDRAKVVSCLSLEP